MCQSRALLSAFVAGRPVDHREASDRLLVVGSGVAGSAAALIAAQVHQIPVTMLYAGNMPTDCNSYWAQGGIIYRNYDKNSGDSADLLASDIHRAGAGLCDDVAVRKVAEEGPERVRQLLLDTSGAYAQVPFDRNDEGELSLCLEASHAAPRILFDADHTGRTISEHISQAVNRHELITQLPHTVVTDLIIEDGVCIGVETLDRLTGRRVSQMASRGTVLASGGLAGIYEHSTNPPGFNALGSSVALASRAGVELESLEYLQFHPTSLYIPNEARFLLTEALRGEGAILRDSNGRAFAKDYHKDGELAPRDVVARAVFEESQKSAENVYLDITHRDAEWLRERFPSIQSHLVDRGLDLTRDALPIIPAAHYTCGGIKTDMDGRTNIPGLFAAGEAACTGLHGGNRLASTSLLEGLVFGGAVADCVAASPAATPPPVPSKQLEQFSPEPWHIQNAGHTSLKLLRRLRKLMWDYVGVARTQSGMETALREVSDLRQEIEHLNATCPTLETAAVRDAAWAGEAVARSALSNTSSAGAHYVVAESDEDDEDMVASR